MSKSTQRASQGTFWILRNRANEFGLVLNAFPVALATLVLVTACSSSNTRNEPDNQTVTGEHGGSSPTSPTSSAGARAHGGSGGGALGTSVNGAAAGASPDPVGTVNSGGHMGMAGASGNTNTADAITSIIEMCTKKESSAGLPMPGCLAVGTAFQSSASECCSHSAANGICLSWCTFSGKACLGSNCEDCCSPHSLNGTCIDCNRNAHCGCPSYCSGNACVRTPDLGPCVYPDCSDCESGKSTSGICVPQCTINSDCGSTQSCKSGRCVTPTYVATGGTSASGGTASTIATGGRSSVGGVGGSNSFGGTVVGGASAAGGAPQAGTSSNSIGGSTTSGGGTGASGATTIACITKADCPAPKPWCDPYSRSCVECLGNWHCGGYYPPLPSLGSLCILGGTCCPGPQCPPDAVVAAPTCGTSLAFCGGPGFCDASRCCTTSTITVETKAYCGNCQLHSDCTGGTKCFEGTCSTLRTCTRDSDCGAAPWTCINGGCSQCRSDGDCSFGFRCDTEIARCRECLSAADCPRTGDVCTGGVCWKP